MAEDKFGILGKVIARTYEVKDVVAEGGFGVVYRAYHQGFRAEVALKCLKIPIELTENQRSLFLEQFRSEAEVLFRLSGHSAHIVRPLHVDAFHTKDGRLVPFIALEWLEGRTLDGLILHRAELGRPPLDLERVVRLLTPVAGALEGAHNLPGKKGPEMVVHRDMKPENIFIARVGGQDIAKILDFGISKVKSTASQMVGRASAHADTLVAFSPAYGSPEQWAPRRYGQTGRWTDVWGLALSVVESVKGQEVVTGDHAEMMGTILDPGRRPTPRNEGLEISDEIEGVFLRALAVDPKKRYQSVGTFWDALTLAMKIQPGVGGPVSLPQPPTNRAGQADLESIAPPASPWLSARPTPGAPGAAKAMQRVPSVDVSGGKDTRGAGASLLGASDAFGGGMQSVVSKACPPRPAVSYAPYDHPSLVKALGPALSLMGLSVAFTLLDRAFAYTRGTPLAFGPVRASWLAGFLMVVAIYLAVSTLRRHWQE